MPQLDPGYRLNGKYELEFFLGEGGSSEVWRVRNIDFDQVRAAKIFMPKHGSDREQMDRFLQEFRATEALDHPHILRPDHIEMDRQAVGAARPFMLMDHCEGGHLGSFAFREHTHRRRGLEEREIAVVMKQVAGALDTLHTRGLVHGDIKPANVLLRDKDSLFCLLSDFGATFKHANSNGQSPIQNREPQTIPLSQIEIESREEQYTVHQEVINDYHVTPEYAAPETLIDETVTEASDLFALGLVLYELATGSLPFPITGKSVAQGETPKGLARSYYSDKLNYILMTCLSPAPEDRQFTARDLAEMAEEYLQTGDWPLVRPGEEVEVEPEYTAPTDWEQVLRITILLAVVLALIGGAWWWWKRQQDPPRFPYRLALGAGGDSVEFRAYAPGGEPTPPQEVPLIHAWRGEPRLGEWTRLGAEDGEFRDSTFRILYEGEWAQKVPHGEGSADFRRDSKTVARYQGEWRNGQIQGEGILALIQPDSADTTALVRGTFNEGRLEQFALPINYAQQRAALQIPNGHWEGNPLQRGNWVMDGYGRGVLRNISDTLFYEGGWKNGLPDGQGTGVFRSGNPTVLVCRGVWQKGEINGFAECLVFNPETLQRVGSFEGKMTRSQWVEGTYKFLDNKELMSFRGTFRNSKPDSGRYMYSSETVFDGKIGSETLVGRLQRKKKPRGTWKGIWDRLIVDQQEKSAQPRDSVKKTY